MVKKKVLERDGRELTALRQDIEAVLGRSIKTSSDFVLLSETIFEKIHENVSVNTLKRIWGYIKDGGSAPTFSTLSVLSRYLGYADFNGFLQNLDETATSQAFLGEGVRVDTLEEDAVIEVQWIPNRRLVIRYTGANSFVVIDSENSKLVPGDTFKCLYIIENQPLYIDELMHTGFEKPMSYICGKQGGVHVVIKDKE